MNAAIGKNVAGGAPVRLSHRDRFTGTYIVGKMGMGKSTLIQSLATEQIDYGHGMLVMEPKGDLVSDLLKLIPKHRVNDVILLDYGDLNYPPGFDLFDLAGITSIHERAAYIREIVNGFEKTLGKDSWGANIENLFMAVANTFTQNPGVVLSDIKRILTDDAFRDRCMRNLTSPFTKDARDFWATYDRMKGKDTYVNGTMTRVQRFLFDPILQAITVQSGRSLDVTKAIRERKIVLIAQPERTLGAKGMELLGTLYLSRIRLATQRQFGIPERERIPFFVYLDEFQRFASGDIESFIAEARGAKVGLTMAHQWRSQIEDPGVRAAPQAVGNTFVFEVTAEDAAVFSRSFSRVPLGIGERPHYAPAERIFFECRKHPWSTPERAQQVTECREAIDKGFTVLQRLASHLEQMRTGEFTSDAWHDLRRLLDLFLCARQYDEFNMGIMKFYNTMDFVTPQTISNAVERRMKYYHTHLSEEEILGIIPRAGEVERTKWTKEFEEEIEKISEEWDAAAKPYFVAAEALGEILRDEPIPNPEPRPAASRTDIATGLTNLPKFHAHAKISQGDAAVELSIAIERIELPAVSYEAEIRERCRRLYCVTMERAMEMIAVRQADEQPPDDDQGFFDEPPRRGGV